MQERHGDITEKMRVIGKKGGSVKGTKGGFAHPSADPRAAGRKGGSISKRKPKAQ